MKIYNDKIRTINIVVVHLLFAFGLISILYYLKPNIVVQIILYALLLLDFYILIKFVLRLLDNNLKYELNSEAISDYSHDRTLSINWDRVQFAEMTSSLSEMQLIVSGMEKDGSQSIIVIERFFMRWRNFNKIWKEIVSKSKTYNFEIREKK